MSRKKKLKSKYIFRRVLFVVLLLLLLGLGALGLRELLGSPEEENGGSSDPAAFPSSQPEPPATQTGGEPEGGLSQSRPEPLPEPEPGSQPESQPEPPSSQEAPKPADLDGDWNLVLINPTHAIEKELDIEFDEVQGYKFDKRITGKIRELIAAAKEDGISLAIVSGYRTMERSRLLYNNKIAEYKNMGYDDAAARVAAARWVAPPGTSEHHSGLAMDIVSADYYTKYSDLVEAFENDKEAIWLKDNCARFGFILRFPKDKTEITGINFEPWHFRYVGEEHAQKIMEQGICLEEYLGETD